MESVERKQVPAWKAAVVKMAAPFLGELLINSGVVPNMLQQLTCYNTCYVMMTNIL